MNEEMELICFQLISNSGGAKSSYVEAIQFAKEGKFSEADTKMEEAENYFMEAHKIHSKLIQQEAAGDSVEFSLLFMHAEDQIANAEVVQLLAKEVIDLYKNQK